MDISGRIQSRHNSSFLRIIVVIAVLVLGAAMIVWSAQSSLQIRSVKASLFVELRNEANYAFNLSGFIYVYHEEPIQFIDIDTIKIEGKNLTVVEIQDGSGIQFYMPQFEPKQSVEFQINNIKVTETLHQRVNSLRFDPSFHFINETDIGYKAVFKIIGKTETATIPAASKYIFTVRLGEKSVLIESESRTHVLEYLKALHLIVFFTLVGFCFSFYSKRTKEWFPFITLIFITLTILIYAYVGSGWEMNYMHNMENYRWLAFVSFLVHGSYDHITGNLVYFALLSALMEMICLHNGKKLPKFTKWYLPPLAVFSIFHGLQFLATGKFSFGLSIVIEVMTWILWAYILKSFRSIVRSRVRIFMVILSGIPSVVFFGWLISYSLFPTRNPYYKNLAEGHIWFGSVSAIIVFLIVFGDQIYGFITSKIRFCAAKNRLEEKRSQKSKANMPAIDLIFISILVSLFLIVVIDFYTVQIDFFFRPTGFGPSIFGILSSVLILYYFVVWGSLKAKESFKIEGGRKKVILKAFRFIGFTRPSSKDTLYLLFSIFIGFMVNLLTLFAISILVNGRLYVSKGPQGYIILQNIIVAPMFEELVYRGICLSVFLRTLGKNYVSAIFGLLLSSFIFGWIHSIQPIVKTFGGLVLGGIYLFRWKKNIVASFFTHMSMNTVGTFLFIAF